MQAKHIYVETGFPAAPEAKTLPHVVSRAWNLTSTCNSENELHESAPLFTCSPEVHEDCKTEEKEGAWTGPVSLGSQESIFNMQNKSRRKEFKSCTKMCFPHHLLAPFLQNPSPPFLLIPLNSLIPTSFHDLKFSLSSLHNLDSVCPLL